MAKKPSTKPERKPKADNKAVRETAEHARLKAALKEIARTSGFKFDTEVVLNWTGNRHADGRLVAERSIDLAAFTRSGGRAPLLFQGIILKRSVSFYEAQFHGEQTSFSGAQFHGQRTSFEHSQRTSFDVAQFHGEKTSFFQTQFQGEETVFTGAQFRSRETSFEQTSFKDGGSVHFTWSSFGGRAIFAGYGKANQTVAIFSGTEVDFTNAVISPLDALSFRDADFRKCRLLQTDLRKVEMTVVTWPRIGKRLGVYDEYEPLKQYEVRPWAHIEKLYRELKQNYEDRRDYERAGDFHYGEKEMRRRNPDTTGAMWLFLNLYWLASGYGEKFLRPLLCAGGLFVFSTLGYLLCADLESTSISWGEAAVHSFQVMTFLRPQAILSGLAAKALYTIQSLLGPLFLGLFALAVRQRLKR